MTAAPSASTPLCARRGGQWLSRQDLQAHLAALLRLENIGILLGSGASMGALGGMTIAKLWENFRKKYAKSLAWLESNNFVEKSKDPNVELLADSMEIATIEWRRVKNGALAELEAVRADLTRAVMDASLLQRTWWADPARADPDASELIHHRAVLQKLTADRQPGQPAPWVFTTNYDLAVEWAAESISLKVINGFDGLHRRVFSPHNFDLGWRNVVARGEARFGTYHVYLAKLHGSLTWEMGEDDVLLESSSSARWPSFDAFLAGGPNTPRVFVLPSAAKYLQTVGFVIGELLRRLAEFLARPQTCLITNGYSFSDDHLNRLLLSALQNPTLHVVMYLPEAVRNGEDLDITKCSKWAQRVLALNSPQVTVVGGAKEAHFDALAGDLPDPAVYDEHAATIRKMLREFRGT